MLKQRVLWGGLIIALITGLLWMDHATRSNNGFFVLMLVVTVWALYEFYQMFANIGLIIPKTLPIILGALFIICQWLQMHTAWRFYDLPVLIFIFFLLGPTIHYLFSIRNESDRNKVVLLFISVFGLFYICFGMFWIGMIRTEVVSCGEKLFIWFIVLNKMADSLAYFGGTLFGKHLLTPFISPKKTVEGLICGVIGGTLFGLLLAWLMNLIGNYNWYAMSVICFISILAGQSGDLVESLIKRYCQVKDSGRLVPALGGVLDMIDCLLLSAPITTWLIYVFRNSELLKS
jgi:phosphatidate cytidylyltransferase